MKIIVTKQSKDGLATVQMEQRHEGSPDQIKALAGIMLDKAGAVLNTRYKQMRAKEKAKARKAGRM